MRPLSRQAPLWAAVLLAAGAACDAPAPTTAPQGLSSVSRSGLEAPSAPSGRMPDFALQDVNPASPRYPGDVSPRDELQRISAWYFGHAT
jgi:hypothetical protein